MSVITPKNKLSQKEYYASHSLKELAKNSLYISLMFGQVLWPMNSAMAAPVFEPGDGDFRFSYTASPDRKDIFIHLIEITNIKTPQAQTSGLYKATWDKHLCRL